MEIPENAAQCDLVIRVRSRYGNSQSLVTSILLPHHHFSSGEPVNIVNLARILMSCAELHDNGFDLSQAIAQEATV